MSKFCTACGTKLADDAVFCTECRARTEPLSAAPQQVNTQPTPAYYQPPAGIPQQARRPRLLPLLSAAIVIAAAVVILVLSLGGGYKSALDTQVAFIEGDFESYDKLYPKKIFEDSFTSEADLKKAKEQYAEIYEEYLGERLSSAYGEDYKINYEVTDEDELSDSELEEFAESVIDKYRASDLSFEQAYYLKLSIHIEGKLDENDGDTEVIAAKIDGEWYICDERGRFTIIGLTMVF